MKEIGIFLPFPLQSGWEETVTNANTFLYSLKLSCGYSVKGLDLEGREFSGRMGSHTNTIFSNSAFTNNTEVLGIQFLFFICLIFQLVQNLGERSGTDKASLESNYSNVFSSRDPFRTEALHAGLFCCTDALPPMDWFTLSLKISSSKCLKLSIWIWWIWRWYPTTPREIFFPGSINKPIDLMQPKCFAQHQSHCDKCV